MGSKNLEGSRTEKQKEMNRESTISLEKWAVYKQTAQKRWAKKQEELACRRERAWSLARQAADLLKTQFGGGQVAVFGSLARGDLFHHLSDVDLAVWGLDSTLYLRAVAQLLSLDPTISIDLVIMEEASSSLQSVVQKEGILL